MCTTNQEKTLTFEEAFDVQTKLARKKGTRSRDLDKTKKKDLIENKSEEDKDHTLESTVVGDNYIKVSEDMSFSRESISVSVRLRRKLKF